MKKTVFLLMITLFISSRNNIFSQSLSGNCPQKELTKEFCKATDTLARFMDAVKRSSPEGVWEKFVADATLGSAAAFNNFGKRGADLKNSFDLLGNDLDKNAFSLIAAIDPNKTLTGEQVKETMISMVKCYYADPVENDIKKLVREGGEPVPLKLDSGPCEIALRSCLSGAASAHNSQLIGCGFGSGGIWRWLGGWWGLASGLLCLIAVENTYNGAKLTCGVNYCDCAHCEL
jgi:hypothetical protein